MARPSTAYKPLAPGHGALYQIVRDHFEAFCGQAATVRDSRPPPLVAGAVANGTGGAEDLSVVTPDF